jgi:FkbH-like protein
MVTTLQFPRNPEEFGDVLSGEGLFDVLQFSAEDLKRTQLYKQRAAAEAARSGARNLDEFYRSLDMEIRMDPVNAGNLARASQLTQKTNQLNLTTYRYNEADIRARADDAAWHCCVVTVRDRFGDHGIIGVLMAHHTGGSLVLDTFLLSCRVIGRSVETAMLAHLSDIALGYGARYIDASLIPTAKNAPVRSVLPDHGFEKVGNRDDATEWRLDVSARRVPWPAWFRVHSPASAPQSA